MRIHILVEDESGVLALQALLLGYREALRKQGHGLRFEPFHDKAELLRKVGPRAAQVLTDTDNPSDRVVALPDLDGDDLEQLRDRMRRSVRDELQQRYTRQGDTLRADLARFYPSVLKHEMEMLLLAAWRPLMDHIGAHSKPSWRQPAEEQNHSAQGRPKAVVDREFRKRPRPRRAYLATVDAPRVLQRVQDIRTDLIYSRSNQPECPIFLEFLGWLREQTGVPVYDSVTSMAPGSERRDRC